jgi:hypothetical protein
MRVWLKIFFAALFLLAPLYVFLGYSDIGDVAPSNTDVLVIVNDPIELTDRVLATDFIDIIRRLDSAKTFDAYLTLWGRLSSTEWAYSLARRVVKTVYVAVPHDRAPNVEGVGIATFYVDLGLAGRVLSDLAQVGLFAPPGEVILHYNQRVFLQGPLAVAFLDNFAMFGARENVLASVGTLAGQELSLNATADRLARMQKLAQADAEVTALIFARQMFRPGDQGVGGFDPRAMLRAAAIDLAVLNVDLQPGGAAIDFRIEPLEGKVISPLTVEKTDAFATASLPDAGTVLYGALRLDRPADLAPMLLAALDKHGRLKKLTRKFALLMLKNMLQHTGQEMAVAYTEESPDLPVYAFRVTDAAAMTEALAKLSREARKQVDALSQVVGPAGETIADQLSGLENKEGLQQLLAETPASLATKIESLAGKLDGNLRDVARWIQDAQRLSVGTSDYYWRMVGDTLLLSASPRLVDRFEKNLAAGNTPAALVDPDHDVPLDGPVLGWINLVPTLDKLTTSLADPAAWLAAKRPHLVIGSVTDGTDLTLRGFLSAEIGLRPRSPEGIVWRIGFWVGQGLLALFGLWLICVIVRNGRALIRK